MARRVSLSFDWEGGHKATRQETVLGLVEVARITSQYLSEEIQGVVEEAGQKVGPLP